MDGWLEPSLPWQLKTLAYLVPGLVVCLCILAIPKRVLARVGQLPLLSPNWITAWSLVIFWAGVALYFSASTFWGFILVVAACSLDRVDGKMAEGFKDANVFRSERDARIGGWFDPLVDKLRLLPMIVILSAQGIVHPGIARCVVGVDVISTFLREPVNIGFKRMRISGASGVGKFKTFMQAMTCLAAIPVELDWEKDLIAPNIICSIALALGVLSILSRMRINAPFDAFVDRLGTLFQHRDV